ncbi:MAG: hypothetical protein RMK74_12510 [Myxococcales bacterium]|nr:hypothetical protein [Myxococcales bacterium]
MHFTRIALANWRNFRKVDVPLRQRMFVVGPNASGKSRTCWMHFDSFGTSRSPTEACNAR